MRPWIFAAHLGRHARGAHRWGRRRLPLSQLQQWPGPRLDVPQRIDDIVAARFVIHANKSVMLTAKGQIFADLFIKARRVFGVELPNDIVTGLCCVGGRRGLVPRLFFPPHRRSACKFENARWLLISYAACFLGTLVTAIPLTAWQHGMQAVILAATMAALTSACLFALYVPRSNTVLTPSQCRP